MTAPLPFTRSPHLVALVAEAERLATLLEGATVADELVGQRLDDATVATLRLDGSPVAGPPDINGLDPADLVGRVADEGRAGTWLDALRVGDAEIDEALVALEYLGARSALGSDDLADALLTDLARGLPELHRRLTRGLVIDEVAGRLRRSDQAVHDASQGRIIFYAPDPSVLADRLAHVATWLASTGAREHGLLTSGVLHFELLALHPFESANGRLARAAARLCLRARGLDPAGLSAPEPELAGDPIGYYDEVARTTRRRDATIWLERWGEAVTAGLRASAQASGALPLDVPDRAAAFVDQRPDPAFTIADYRADVGVGPEDARNDLGALLDAGRIRRVPASRGLRYETT